MANQSFALELKAVNLIKFSEATTGDILGVANGKTSINILPQILEVDIFQSIFSTVMRCELAILDSIALFTNFPITGEELIVVKYKNEADKIEKNLVFVIDTISDIHGDKSLKNNTYIIKGVAIEAYANALGTVMQAYDGTIPDICRAVLDEHIFKKTKEIFPSYRAPSTYFENNEVQSSTIVIPNVAPFKALGMLSQLMVSEVSDKYNFLFYQTTKGFSLNSIQELTQRPNQRRVARANSYRFLSNEISENSSTMNNEERIISHLEVNRRFGALSKLSIGYFNNKLFEVNIAQKAIWIEPSKVEDVKGISNNKLNTEKYIETTSKYLINEEDSNRVKYKITAQAEGDQSFPISRIRSRWGKDLITNSSMSQIDLTVVIPGTNRFEAGDLFFVEFPENTSFTDPKMDDLITGYFLITEVKHTLTVGGLHTTVLRINKDSYNTSIDREARYG